MLKAISGWRKPDKQAANDAARERGSRLGMADWVVPRDQVQLGARIGEGGFGVVFKCKYKEASCVAKQIAPAKLAPKDLPLLQNEMCLWAQLDHRNCVKFFGVAFEPTDFYYLLCEFMTGGSLFDRHVKNRAKSKRAPPRIPELLPEMRQVADAMEHLHSKHIVHRDLKSANVLIAADGRLCVADFGLVRYVPPVKDGANMTAETGSYRWMAPEVIRHEPYGKGCDVYSYAVLCWEMLTNSIPFPHHTPVEVALSVATKGLRPDLPSYVPTPLAELVARCWQQDASLRPSFEEIYSRLGTIEAAEALRDLPSAAPASASPSSSGAPLFSSGPSGGAMGAPLPPPSAVPTAARRPASASGDDCSTETLVVGASSVDVSFRRSGADDATAAPTFAERGDDGGIVLFSPGVDYHHHHHHQNQRDLPSPRARDSSPSGSAQETSWVPSPLHSEHSGSSSNLHRSPGDSLSGRKRGSSDRLSSLQQVRSVIAVDTSPPPADLLSSGYEAYPGAAAAGGAASAPGAWSDADFESAMKRPKSVDSNLSSAADRALNMCNRHV